MTNIHPPPPPAVARFPSSLIEHTKTAYTNTVREAREYHGISGAVQAAVRTAWIILDSFVLDPLKNLFLAVRIFSFYYRGEGIARDCRYGKREHQVCDIYYPPGARGEGASKVDHNFSKVDSARGEGGKGGGLPVVMFVHGGSWALGDKKHFALLAKALREEGGGAVVGVVRYGLYPSFTMEEMLEDISAAVDFALGGGLEEFGGDASKVSLMGHSAGAQLVAMAALRRAQLRSNAAGEGEFPGTVPGEIERLLLVSGPYDIPRHYEWERARGVHILSPMHIVTGSSVESQNSWSPTYSVTRERAAHLPPTLLLHASNDATVPASSSCGFLAALSEAGAPASMLDLGDSGHGDFLLDLMLGRDTPAAATLRRAAVPPRCAAGAPKVLATPARQELG